MVRRAAAKQANIDAARERKQREASRAEADRLQRERNNIMVNKSGLWVNPYERRGSSYFSITRKHSLKEKVSCFFVIRCLSAKLETCAILIRARPVGTTI